MDNKIIFQSGLTAAKFHLIGGFLGAGKTTCLAVLAKHFQEQGLRVGIITNDQGTGLVDTLRMAATGDAGALREITGGCFCCKADQLVDVINQMAADAAPDVILAEPVGSCTDLVATVLQPLVMVYKLPLVMAPMSVVTDARRLHDMYFAKPGKAEGFSRDVRYIFLKQMEEAELLILNKWDLLADKERTKLKAKLEADWPGKQIIPIVARDGTGVDVWLEAMESGCSKPGGIMQVDYEQYGRGEALLGWYNATLAVTGAFTNKLLLGLVGKIQQSLEADGIAIAHLKASLEVEDGGLCVAHVVRTGQEPEYSAKLANSAASGTVLINLRAEGTPEALEAAVAAAVSGLPLDWKEKAAFKPGQPKPVHRVAKLA